MLYNSETGNILLVDKPYSWTSFDVIGFLRLPLREQAKIKKIKIGHAGTLDPLATGLLIVCVGKATKEIEKFQNLQKEYLGIITIGATTPSYDLETKITSYCDYSHITENQIYDNVKSFLGKIKQIPPIYSAIKINGKRAYKHARNKEDAEIKPREIEIYSFEITKIELPDIHFKINCSKGTYIRSIANDFGAKLGVGAYLKELRRTKIGDFNVENALTIEEYKQLLDPNGEIIKYIKTKNFNRN